jgi:hypothetical protein
MRIKLRNDGNAEIGTGRTAGRRPRCELPRRVAVACLVAAMLVLSTPQHAAGNPLTSQAVKEQCGAEIRSLCIRPWRLLPDAINACMETHRAELSPICQDFWSVALMCQAEMRRVCGGLNPLTIKSCVRESRDQFSQTCQETMQ